MKQRARRRRTARTMGDVIFMREFARRLIARATERWRARWDAHFRALAERWTLQ